MLDVPPQTFNTFSRNPSNLHPYAASVCLPGCVWVDMNFKMPYFLGVGVFGKWLGMMGMAAVAA